MDSTRVAHSSPNPALDGLDGLVAEPFTRRAFVMSSVITGFTLATTVVHAQAIHTDATGLVAGDVQIPTADGNMPGYRAMPVGSGPFPLIVVVEEIYGVHEYIKDICRRLAQQGYCAVAPEIYARQGDLSKMTDTQQIMRDVISKAPDAQIMSDLDASVAWAVKDSKGDESRLGITGFCRGGRAVWLYAVHNPRLKAAVAWYGPLNGERTTIQPKTAADVAADIKVPLLGLYGASDPGIPAADVEKQREAARAAGKTVEIVLYPDTGHAFHADYRATYRKEAAEDGWKRMLAWFKQYGVA